MSNSADIPAGGEPATDPTVAERAKAAISRLVYISDGTHGADRVGAALALIPDLIAEVERLSPRRVETVEELDGVPARAVVRSASGTIACRYDGRNGVVFGDDRPFPWHKLALPVEVLWSPGDAQ